jgi:hypothetical protein
MTIENLRKAYHKKICKRILGLKSGIPNLADVSSKTSKILSTGLVKKLGFSLCKSPPAGLIFPDHAPIFIGNKQ